jgi:hypothetical protein
MRLVRPISTTGQVTSLASQRVDASLQGARRGITGLQVL